MKRVAPRERSSKVHVSIGGDRGPCLATFGGFGNVKENGGANPTFTSDVSQRSVEFALQVGILLDDLAALGQVGVRAVVLERRGGNREGQGQVPSAHADTQEMDR